jgi:hypothetical protein
VKFKISVGKSLCKKKTDHRYTREADKYLAL